MYNISLTDFEGPLDLLLFFIRRDELDVYDIPIAKITNEYLSYVKLIEEIDLDGAAEFIYMASLLISIKAKMLLPRPELDEFGEEIDPRRELVERLLEYMRYKEASDHIEAHLENRQDHFERGFSAGEQKEIMASTEQSYDLSVFHLMAALQRVLDRIPDEEPTHAVRYYDFTITEQREYVINKIKLEGRLAFIEMISEQPKQFVIVTFLAVLELTRSGKITIQIGGSNEDFYITDRSIETDDESGGDSTENSVNDEDDL